MALTARDKRDLTRLIRELRTQRRHGVRDFEVAELTLDTGLHANRLRSLIEKHGRILRRNVGCMVKYEKGLYQEGSGLQERPGQASRVPSSHYYPARVELTKCGRLPKLKKRTKKP